MLRTTPETIPHSAGPLPAPPPAPAPEPSPVPSLAPPQERLGHPFHMHLSSVALSNLVDGMVLVGVPLLAVSLTRSPQEIAWLSTLFWLPWLLFGLASGVLVDRLDRRAVRLAATTGRVVLLGAVAVLAATGYLSLALLVVAMGLYGLTQVLVDLSARAIVPQLVPASRLAAANGRTMAAERVFDDFIGRPLGGLLVVAGAGWLFGAAAAVGVTVVLLLALGLTGPFRPGDALPGAAAGPEGSTESGQETEPSGTAAQPSGTQAESAKAPAGVVPAEPAGAWREVRQGLGFLVGHRVLRPVAIMASAANLAMAAYLSVFILWVVGPGSAVGLTADQYPPTMVVMAAGAILATVVIEPLKNRLPEVPLMLTGWMAQVPLLVLPVLWPRLDVLLAAWFLSGFCNMTGNVLAMTLMQQLTPNHLLGRVNGATSTLAFGLMPLGALAGGFVGERLGLPVVFLGAAAVLGLAVLYAMLAIPGRGAGTTGPDAGHAPRPVPSPPWVRTPLTAGRDLRPTDPSVQRVLRAGALGGGPGLR
ncbi:MFS transporter [Citricoccus nitrophenolicus]|uniref:MFS transporter n=1 Tax=Citricoccus nitrophenolicus TaxID=863575 RepID=A0ABV0IKS6_9MICC